MTFPLVSQFRRYFRRLSRLPGAAAPAGHALVGWLFLRLLALVYMSAFASFGLQVLGLIGSEGILPVKDYLSKVRDYLGLMAYWRVPSVFWFDASDLVLRLACAVGALLSVFLFLGFLHRISLVLLYLLYLSVFYAGQVFTAFQWDLLLLETGFLAIFLPLGSDVIIWLYRWLLFRLLFLSGAVKLLSGDPNWVHLTALNFHYQTQPLPTMLAWYAQQLPEWFQRLCVAATFGIELVIPFLIFFPRRFRFLAAYAFLGLQGCILLTGNYNFFNLLTMALCLFLFDDAALSRCLPVRLWARANVTTGTAARNVLAGGLASLILCISGVQILETFGLRSPFAATVAEVLAPMRIASPYGLFAVMTTERAEISIEGSNDGRTWNEYQFPYKPGDVQRRPEWNIPHQPQLDWQMWFAALETQGPPPWFSLFLRRLLEGAPPVLALMGGNPFPDAPPKYVRAMLYRYAFSDPGTKRRLGNWWVRTPEGSYYPPVSLPEGAAEERGPASSRRVLIPPVGDGEDWPGHPPGAPSPWPGGGFEAQGRGQILH